MNLLHLIERAQRRRPAPARLGSHDVFVEAQRIGRGVVTRVYEIRDDRVTVALAVEDSYRDDVAVALVEAAGRVAEPGDVVDSVPLAVDGFPLDRAVVLGPGGHDLFASVPELAARATVVVPVHRSEIVEGEDGDAFWFAGRGKGAGINPHQWDRAPRPRADLQLLDEWPGGPFRRTARLLPRPAEPLLTRDLPELARGVRARVRTAGGTELVLARRWDRLVGTATAPGDAAPVAVDVPRAEAWPALASLFGVDAPKPPHPAAPETDVLEYTYSTADRGYARLAKLAPLDDCVARLSAHIIRTAGNVAVFTSRSEAVVQVRCEDDQRLWLETPDPGRRQSHGRHVTLAEAETMLRVLAREDRSAVADLGNLHTRSWE